MSSWYNYKVEEYLEIEAEPDKDRNGYPINQKPPLHLAIFNLHAKFPTLLKMLRWLKLSKSPISFQMRLGCIKGDSVQSDDWTLIDTEHGTVIYIKKAHLELVNHINNQNENKKRNRIKERLAEHVLEE